MSRRPNVCERCGQVGTIGNQVRGGILCEACKAAAFIEDFEWLCRTGCGWGEIIKRLGLQPETIERRFDRYNRPDLSQRWRDMIEDEGSWHTSGWRAKQLQHINGLRGGHLATRNRQQHTQTVAA